VAPSTRETAATPSDGAAMPPVLRADDRSVAGPAAGGRARNTWPLLGWFSKAGPVKTGIRRASSNPADLTYGMMKGRAGPL